MFEMILNCAWFTSVSSTKESKGGSGCLQGGRQRLQTQNHLNHDATSVVYPPFAQNNSPDIFGEYFWSSAQGHANVDCAHILSLMIERHYVRGSGGVPRTVCRAESLNDLSKFSDDALLLMSKLSAFKWEEQSSRHNTDMSVSRPLKSPTRAGLIIEADQWSNNRWTEALAMQLLLLLHPLRIGAPKVVRGFLVHINGSFSKAAISDAGWVESGII